MKLRRPVNIPRSRDDAVGRLRHDLQTHGWARSQMTLLVALTGGSGLLASFLLLQAGLDSMALRYPLALLLAYGVFLLLWLWLWLRTKADELLLDGALSATLHRRLRGIERRHWVSTALRKNSLPFALTALLLTAVGWGLHTAAPGARALGEAVHHVTPRP